MTYLHSVYTCFYYKHLALFWGILTDRTLNSRNNLKSGPLDRKLYFADIRMYYGESALRTIISYKKNWFVYQVNPNCFSSEAFLFCSGRMNIYTLPTYFCLTNVHYWYQKYFKNHSLMVCSSFYFMCHDKYLPNY